MPGSPPRRTTEPVDHAAAQGAVEFRQAAHLPDLGGRLEPDQRLGGLAPGRQVHLRHGRRGGHLFGHGTPGAAIGAAAQPFGRLVATVLTDKHGSSGAGCHGLRPSFMEKWRNGKWNKGNGKVARLSLPEKFIGGTGILPVQAHRLEACCHQSFAGGATHLPRAGLDTCPRSFIIYG